MCKNEVTSTITLNIGRSEALALSRKIENKICKDSELSGFHYNYNYLKENNIAQFTLSGSEEQIREYSELLKA